jgi:hypothetical protein
VFVQRHQRVGLGLAIQAQVAAPHFDTTTVQRQPDEYGGVVHGGAGAQRARRDQRTMS